MEKMLRVLVVQREAVEQKLSRVRCAVVHSDERPNLNIRNLCFLKVHLDNVKRCGEEYQHIQGQIYALPLSHNQRFEHTEAHFAFGSLYNETANTLSMLIEYATRAAEEESSQEAVTGSVRAPFDPEPVAQPTTDDPLEDCTTTTKPGAPESLDEDCRSTEDIDENPTTEHPLTESAKVIAMARNHSLVTKNKKNKKIKLKKCQKCKISHKFGMCGKFEITSESANKCETSDACLDSPTEDRDRENSSGEWQDSNTDLSSDTLMMPTVANTTLVDECGRTLEAGIPAEPMESLRAAATCTENPSLHLTAVGRANGLCDILPPGRVLKRCENLLTRRMVHEIDADKTVGETNDSNVGGCRMRDVTGRIDYEGGAAIMDKPVAFQTRDRPTIQFNALTGHIPRERMQACKIVNNRVRVDLPIDAGYIWILQICPFVPGAHNPALRTVKLRRIIERVMLNDGPIVARSLFQTVDVKRFIEWLSGFYKNGTSEELHPTLTLDGEERLNHDRRTHERCEEENLLQSHQFWTSLTCDEDWISFTDNHPKLDGHSRGWWSPERCISVLLADSIDRDDATRARVDPEERIRDLLAFVCTAKLLAIQKHQRFDEMKIDWDDPGPLLEVSWKCNCCIQMTVLNEVRMPRVTLWNCLPKINKGRGKLVRIPEAEILAALLSAGVLMSYRDKSGPVSLDIGGGSRLSQEFQTGRSEQIDAWIGMDPPMFDANLNELLSRARIETVIASAQWSLHLNNVDRWKASHERPCLECNVYKEKTTCLTKRLVDTKVLRLMNPAQIDGADKRHRFNGVEALLGAEHDSWRVTRRQHELKAHNQGLLLDKVTCASVTHVEVARSSWLMLPRTHRQEAKQYLKQTKRLGASKTKEDSLLKQNVPPMGWPIDETAASNVKSL